MDRGILRDPSRVWVQRSKRVVARGLTARPVGAAVRVMTRGVVPSHGMRFDTRSSVVKDSTRAEMLWGLYEGAEVRLLRKHMLPTRCVVDLGVSLGVLSSCAAAVVPEGGRILGVEANPALHDIARANLARNAPHLHADVVAGAIDYSREAGTTVTFAANEAHTGSAIGDSSAGGFSATVIHLNELLSDHGIADFTLLADIEGAEVGLFLNDAESLEKCQQIIAELHPATFEGAEYTAADALELVRDLGFRLDASYGTVHVLTR